MEFFHGLFFVYLAVYFVIYILPMIIAFNRHHENYTAIFLLNLLLGWTLVGWVVALVWAIVGRRRMQVGERHAVSTTSDRYKMIEQITALKNGGSLSEEEFEREKTRILNQ